MNRKSQIQYAFVKLMDENNTQGKDLAEYLDVKPSTISNYRNGTRSIDIDTLCKICEYYDIPLSEILVDDNRVPLTLSDDERDLIETFRTLDNTSRKAVVQLVKTLSSETGCGGEQFEKNNVA